MMRHIPLFLAITILASVATAAYIDYPARRSANMGRECIFAAGSGWTAVDCSLAAAYSAVLNADSRYVVQAIGGDPYFAVATAGSGQDADSNDGYLPSGSWLVMATPASPVYLTCDGSADTSSLVYLECR